MTHPVTQTTFFTGIQKKGIFDTYAGNVTESIKERVQKHLFLKLHQL